MEFLTTSEAADYLRLGERKLYELVTNGAIPCSKVTGKWLFPRHELDLWVLSGLARRPACRPPSRRLPLLWENLDLAMRQRNYFRPSMQALIRFLSEKRLRQRAEELTGYDPSPAGQIRFAA
jgi:excisionase family DNA binding protein